MGTAIQDTRRGGQPVLLHYRSWQGTLQHPLSSVWPIARTSLSMIFRRKLFWGLYALGMMIFLLNFFGLYLLLWLETQTAETRVRAGFLGRLNVQKAIRFLRKKAHLDGSGETYVNYFHYQGYTVMMVLTLAGAILIGNDLRFGSLPYYLSKPLSPLHYLMGKGLAVAVFVNLMTTVPALILFIQYGIFDPSPPGDVGSDPAPYILAYGIAMSLGVTVLMLARLPWLRWVTLAAMVLGTLLLFSQWDYVQNNYGLLLGILSYGLILTISLTLLLLATASWLQKTVPLIMAWTTLFVFCRRLTAALVERLGFHERWRLLDVWNDIRVVGSYCLETPLRGRHPSEKEAALVLLAVCLVCLVYLIYRIRGVEIVR